MSPGRAYALSICAFVALCCGQPARADEAESWREIETKYIFGFTTGSGIGIEDEKELTATRSIASASATAGTMPPRRSTNMSLSRRNSCRSNSARSARPTTFAASPISTTANSLRLPEALPNSAFWGREVGSSLPLNLAEFERHRARLKFAWEF